MRATPQTALPLALGLATLLLAVVSLHLGARATAPGAVWRALTGSGMDAEALIVRTLRVPRAVLAASVGAMLGLSGLLMQGATRNPIAEPGLIGVNAGAALAVVATVVLWGDPGPMALVGIAAAGALLAGGLVFGLVAATTPGFPPAGLLLSGMAVSSLLAAGVQVLVLLDEAALEELLFWLAGAFADQPLDRLLLGLLALGAGAAGALALAPSLDALATDDATAGALGVDAARVRVAALGSAAVLAGAGVALAGPVAFLGLAAPHLARLTGARGHRALVPAALLWGALLALAADVAARYVLHPTEAPVSAVTALLGVPLLVVLLRRGRA